MKSLSLPDRALRPMRWLAEVTRCTAQLADDQAMYIQKVEGPGLIQFDSYIGKRTNLHRADMPLTMKKRSSKRAA